MQALPSNITPIYPELGRQLSSKDVNQTIVRVRPYFHDGSLSFDFIPKRIEDAMKAAFQLIEIDLTGMVVLSEGAKRKIGKAEAFAPVYLTVTEFKEKAVFARIVHFDLNRRPYSAQHEIRLTERAVYPNLGRELKSYDLNRKMVRTYPSIKDNAYDYSFIPMGQNLANENVDTLISINDSSVEFKSPFFRSPLQSVRDNNFLPPHEFSASAKDAKKEVHVLAVGQLIEIRK